MENNIQEYLDEANGQLSALRYLFGQVDDEPVELTHHEIRTLLQPIQRNVKAALKRCEKSH